MGFFTSIANELLAFVAWLWGKAKPPKRLPWCAAFYFVAQEDATLEYPENTLDQKMSETVAAVKRAAKAVKGGVHVVYRTVPSDPVTLDPVAKVVRRLGPKTIFFRDCYDPGTTLAYLDTGKDLTCFLKWVYRWCPADHYAIFIWGHSFGPGGLFEPGGELSIPKPGLTALKEAFEQFKATRTAGDPPPPPRSAAFTVGRQPGSSATGSSGGSNGAQAVQQWAAEGDKKIEIVLFQDCWMSTLETAFEIAPSTSRMVASQSLIPVGRLYANFMWPYANLLRALSSPSFAEDMTNLIAQFYVDHFAQVLSLSSIPITLLDLSKVPEIEAPLSALIGTLWNLSPSERRPLVEPARLARLDLTNPYDPILLAGDGALVDMLTLCAALKLVSWPAQGSLAAQTAAQQAVLDAETELAKLVILNIEAKEPATATLGFRGVSAFHWPPVGVATDDYITGAVRLSERAYRSLQFASKTRWDQIALENKP